MKKIPLTQGQFALVDDEDFEYLNQWKWLAHRRDEKYTFYAMRSDYSNGKKTLRMHNVIAKKYNYSNCILAHMDKNGLNNQKENLIASNLSEVRQYRRNFGSIKYKGVSKNRGTFRSRIQVDKKYICLGYFKTELLAARAYDEAAKKYFGKFAILNFPNA